MYTTDLSNKSNRINLFKDIVEEIKDFKISDIKWIINENNIKEKLKKKKSERTW